MIKNLTKVPSMRLTAENLSETFGLPLDVTVNAGRYTATASR